MSKLVSQRKDLKWGKEAKKGHRNPNFNGGAYIDDKGYVRVLRPDHPYENHRYVYAHRLVMEEALGRYLHPEETIHHINEIKLDNRWDNLFLTTVPEHSQIHREGKRSSMSQKTNMRKKVRARAKKKGIRKRNPDGTYRKSE